MPTKTLRRLACAILAIGRLDLVRVALAGDLQVAVIEPPGVGGQPDAGLVECPMQRCIVRMRQAHQHRRGEQDFGLGVLVYH